MATTLVYPTSDVTANWTSTGANSWSVIDDLPDDTGQPDADFISHDAVDVIDEWNLGDTPAGTSEVTQVDVGFWIKITDASGSASVDVDLRHTGSTVSLGVKTIKLADAGGSGVGQSITPLSWTGLTLTKTQADSLSVRVTLKATGSP